MSLTIERFDEFFKALWNYEPFPWQTRLAKQVGDEDHGWPDCIDLPTASGKTAAIDVAVFALACQAEREPSARTAGRRIFFTVNRRVIVDEAFERAEKLAKRLLYAKQEDGILKEVADALRAISGDKNTPPLDIAQLRGGIYRDRAWARSLTQPIVVCTTADQLGSRLLFRGYGVSPGAAPIHAALCGCDSLVLLDEAHVTKAFSQTMQLLTRYQAQHRAAPRMQFVQMTATPAGGVKRVLQLDDADRSHPLLNARLQASKPATLVPLGKKKPIADKIASRAFESTSQTTKTIAVIVNRVQTAREVAQQIQAKVENPNKEHETFEAEVHLVIGRMRPIDRDDLQGQLRKVVGPDRPPVARPDDKTVFVVATQCLEVGADYDFDALVTECASIDALRQRFGRLNRRGRPIEAYAAIVADEKSLKGDDPIYGAAIQKTWEWLAENDRQMIDFGIDAFKELWDQVDESKRHAMLAPAPDAAVLLPAHLDALCQTNPQPVPSPDVSYFIHGPQRDMAEVNVCWRADLGDDPSLWSEIVRLLPPTSYECMTVPLWEFQRWMRGEKGAENRDADVPVAVAEEAKPKANVGQTSHAVLVWRWSRSDGDNVRDRPTGKGAQKRELECTVIRDPSQLRPGDTVVMPVNYDNWNDIGHIPPRAPVESENCPDDSADDLELRRRLSVDVAEQAARKARRRLVVRLHRDIPNRECLRSDNADILRKNLKSLYEAMFDPHEDEERKELDRVLESIEGPFEPHEYPHFGDEELEAPDKVVVFKDLLEQPDKLVVPPDDEDDGTDGLSESDKFLPLCDHLKHVMERMADSLAVLPVGKLERTVRSSAPLHDLGKADVRFLAMLAGVTPDEAMMLPRLLGKGDGQRLTVAERTTIRSRAKLPERFRHEMLSMQLVEHRRDALAPNENIDLDLLLHLIAAHHGYARPFAPVVVDEADAELLSIEVTRLEAVPDLSIAADERKAWIPAHRLDSGVAERFWNLTRQYGWWGLAWLESILRLADQQASAAEQREKAR